MLLQRKVWHDRHIKQKLFQEGIWTLLYVSRFMDFKGKLMKRWLVQYLIENCHDNRVIKIRTIDEEGIP